ncbi:hypothetical protein ABW20_dc0103063 [Dactylellina cionopaga]|nr:hypothetical protein ABW20_dc0103063 [Dactylellina cionopaga]
MSAIERTTWTDWPYEAYQDNNKLGLRNFWDVNAYGEECSNNVVTRQGAVLNTIAYYGGDINPDFPFYIDRVEIHQGTDCQDDDPTVIGLDNDEGYAGDELVMPDDIENTPMQAQAANDAMEIEDEEEIEILGAPSRENTLANNNQEDINEAQYVEPQALQHNPQAMDPVYAVPQYQGQAAQGVVNNIYSSPSVGQGIGHRSENSVIFDSVPDRNIKRLAKRAPVTPPKATTENSPPQQNTTPVRASFRQINFDEFDNGFGPANGGEADWDPFAINGDEEVAGNEQVFPNFRQQQQNRSPPSQRPPPGAPFEDFQLQKDDDIHIKDPNRLLGSVTPVREVWDWFLNDGHHGLEVDQELRIPHTANTLPKQKGLRDIQVVDLIPQDYFYTRPTSLKFIINRRIVHDTEAFAT